MSKCVDWVPDGAERKAFAITGLLEGDWLINVGEELEAGVTRMCDFKYPEN